MIEYLEIVIAILITVLTIAVIGGIVALGFMLYKFIKDED